MRFSLMAALLLASSSLASAQLRTPNLTPLKLQPTPNGVILDATMQPRNGKTDALQRAFVAKHATVMLLCQARCKPVKELPLDGATTFGSTASHRVIVGGKFNEGQKVHFILQFASGVAVVEAVVASSTP